MALYRRSFSFLALIIILLLIVIACVRPFGQSDEEAAQATAEAEVTAQAEIEDQQAEPADEDAGSTEADEVVKEQDEEATTADEDQVEADEASSESGEDQEEAEEQTDENAAGSEDSSSETVDENAAEDIDADSSEEAAGEELSDEDAATDQDSSMDADSDVAETAPETAPESDAGETTATTPVPLPAVHVVSKGENLFRIGLRYGLSWVPLARYNNIPNPDLIYVGQNIHIPGGQAPPAQSKPESSSYTNYVVKRGDTLFRISRAFGVSLEEIVEANGIVNPSRIYAGQVLKIPTGTL